MNFLFQNRLIKDQIAIGKICFDILSQKLSKKEYSEEFCGIWVDGRNREINSIEDLASIKSFYLNSQKNYPMLVFCHNDKNFLDGLDISNLPIQIIKIDEINSHDAYSKFCKFKLPFLIPDKYNNLLFLQCDAFVIKNGWENYLNNINVDYIGSSWKHTPFIEFYIKNQWVVDGQLKPSFVGNGGASFRTLSNLKYISKKFQNIEMREFGTLDKDPPEDLFYSYLTQLNGRLATKEQSDSFSKDPSTLSDYNDKKCFIGHFPVYN